MDDDLPGEDERLPPDQLANVDQALKFLEMRARFVRRYYDLLLEHEFSEIQAMTLAVAYQNQWTP